MIIDIPDNWWPTPAGINILPGPLRRFIHDLESNTDPAGMVSENVFLKAQVKGLEAKLEAEREEAREDRTTRCCFSGHGCQDHR